MKHFHVIINIKYNTSDFFLSFTIFSLSFERNDFTLLWREQPTSCLHMQQSKLLLYEIKKREKNITVNIIVIVMLTLNM